MFETNKKSGTNNEKLVFVVKTSFDCNMRCAYCYEGHTSVSDKMTVSTALNLTRKLGDFSSKNNCYISYVWHGGEPLLLGHDFFQAITKEQKSFGPHYKYLNHIQTNGLLLDDRYASFFAENDFALGISIDGPPIVHDAQRLTLIGRKPSFKQVYKALVKMDDLGHRPGALAVFTKNTYENLDVFYDFFRDRHLNVQINPLLVMGSAKDEPSKKLQVTPKEFGEAMIHLFNRWISEPDGSFTVQPFDYIVRNIVSGTPNLCIFAGGCQNFFKVFPNGNMHLCGRHPYEKFTLGNINNDTIDSILQSPQRSLYALQRSAVAETCGKCKHFNICNGGCRTSAYTRSQDVAGRNFYCEGFYDLFDHVTTVLSKQFPQKVGTKLSAIPCI